MNFAKSLRTSILQASVRACLKSKIFTRVSFLKILGFCCKQSKQLFYYEGTFKIPERVNRVTFQNSPSCSF